MFAVHLMMDAVGIALVIAVLFDVFQSVIVPRAVGRAFRVTYLLWRGFWALWPELSLRLFPDNPERREDFLATFAPLMLVSQLVLWSFLLLVGFGLLVFASAAQIKPAPENFFQALYFAGTSFFTIGFGDFVGATGWTRAVSLAAGASGFGVVSTVTAFLFAIFGSFQQREQFVTLISGRSGTPPNGVGFLVIAAHADIREGLNETMRSAQAWSSLILETHLAYPSLTFFRSSHDYQSWVGTLGTLLDAATLLMTTVHANVGEARIMYDIGRHAARDLSGYFHLTIAEKDSGISRDEFERACDRLQHAGWELHDRDEAWKRFAALRAAYAPQLNALARFFEIPPLQWIGDRSLLSMHQVPHLSSH